MKMIKLLSLLGLGVSYLAQAGIVLYPSRLVVTSSDSAGVLESLQNTAPSSAFLVQSYISYPDGQRYPGLASAYFQVVPPLTRVEAKGKAVVRIVPLAALAQLPQDRESLFYFNAKAIPSLAPLARNPAERNTGASVAMTITTRLKLFYRPRLAMSAAQAYGQLQFIRQPGLMRVKNPTPYYIQLAKLSFAGQPVALQQDGNDLLAPFGEQLYAANSQATTVSWTVLSEGAPKTFGKALF